MLPNKFENELLNKFKEQKITLEEAIDKILELQATMELSRLQIEGLKRKYYYQLSDYWRGSPMNKNKEHPKVRLIR